MKTTLIRLGVALYCMLSSTLLLAQNKTKSASNSQIRITTCTPEGLAGLIKYDLTESAAKLGLESGTADFEKFGRLLKDHDQKVDAIVEGHRLLFDRLYSLKTEYEDRATAEQDFQPLVKLIRLMEEELEPIGEEVAKENDYLNVLAAHVLGEKKYSKWERYQHKVKKAQGPHYPRPMAGPLMMD